MYQNYDTYNSHLTTYAQGLWLYPGKETDLARLFFPVVGVETTVGTFDKWDIAPGLTPVDTRLTRDNSPRRIRLNKTEGTWSCAPQALEIPTFGPALLQKGHATQLREAHIRTLMSAQFASRQKAAADAVSAAVAATSGLGAWSADTDIIGELETLMKQVVSTSGKRCNHLAIGVDAWVTLRNHASVLDRASGLSYAITPEHLAEMLIYKGITITVVDSYIADPATKVITPLLNADVFAFYNEESPSLEDMSFGKEFTLTPGGPEVLSYKEHGGVNEVDALMWSSDCQIVNPGSCARLTVTAA